MLRRLTVGSLIVLVTGCGEPQGGTASPPPAPLPLEQKAPDLARPHFEWIAGQYEDRGQLAFAVAETDNIQVGLQCRHGTRSVRVSAVDPNASGTRLVFGSGNTRDAVQATPSHDTMIDDATYAAAIVELDHPTLAVFEASGELWVWNPELPMRANSDTDRHDIAQFFAFCRGSLDSIASRF